MRITEQIIDAFLLGSGAGAGIGAALTYWAVTSEKRLISKIRRSIDFLSNYHTLSDAQYRKVRDTESLVSDKEILAYHRFSIEHKAESRKRRDDPINKIGPATIAAEIIICERLLGLNHLNAIHALRRPIEELQSLGQKNSN